MKGDDLVERLAGFGPADALAFIRGLDAVEATAFVTFLVFTVAFFAWVAWITVRR